MADGLELDPGAGGATVATDDAGAAGHVQINKLAISADGDATAIPADAANGLDVDVTRSALPSGAATSAKQDTVIGHLDGVEGLLTTIDADTGAIAAAVSGTEVQVDIVSSAAIPVTDNGSTLSVDGTVTVQDGGGALTVDNGGTFAVQVDGAALTALQLLDDTIIADDAAFTAGSTKVAVAGFVADQTSTDNVNEGDAGAARMTYDRKQIVTVAPNDTTEGLDAFRSADMDETEEDVKTSPGKVYGWAIYNDGASEVFFQLWNATAANTTPGTTTPKITFPVPAGSSANVEFTNGITFDTAISVGATTGFSDAGAPAAAQVSGMVFYK